MNGIEQLLKELPELESMLGYKFHDSLLLVMAFTHRSYINENRTVTQHNERLEFLGDSVLGLLISEYLYTHLPQETPEGDLSSLRSRLVDAASCIAYVLKLQVEKFLLLGKGEKRNDGRGRESILSDLFEAIIGAVYLDGGIEAARKFLFSNFSSEISSLIENPLHNWKALLQDHCQKKFQQAPKYQVLEETGPDHSKLFKIAVFLGEEQLGSGSGSSKKEAQQAAAADALARISTR
jgi:ribonuclease-3